MGLRINHVSVNAVDLQTSVDWYVDLLGAEPLTTPNFGLPVQWLALGRTQLHLFERDLTPTSHHHLGITVDDLEPVYRVAERRNAFDDVAFGNRLVELPGDSFSSTSATRPATWSRSTSGAPTGWPTICARCCSRCGASTSRATSR